METIEGRKFDWDEKKWSVPSHKKRELWEALQASYEGQMAVGPKGVFTI